MSKWHTKKGFIVLTGFVVLFLSFYLIATSGTEKRERCEQINPGMTLKDVKTTMGEPNKVDTFYRESYNRTVTVLDYGTSFLASTNVFIWLDSLTGTVIEATCAEYSGFIDKDLDGVADTGTVYSD